MKTIEIKETVGDENEKSKITLIKQLILFFTQYPALFILIIASAIAFVAERLLLDTHHVEITCKPKN